ncbi:MAG: phytanoyl-CoA dioxygenase family protein [Solimonas sp.]
MNMSDTSINSFSLAWSNGAPTAKELQSHVERDGFVIVKNVFTKDEISRLRSIVYGHLNKKGARFSLGKTQPNAALAVPDLQYIFYHDRVVDLFKRLIGPNETVFTGHCDIHMNMLSGWHKDSGEVYGGYFKGDYINADDCRVFKMAIYLQDATKHDGLTVRIGSHRKLGTTDGAPIQAKTQSGDVVLFDVRLTHTGQLPDNIEKGIKALNIALKGSDRRVEDHPLATKFKGIYWKLINRRDRLSIFFTFGKNNAYTQQFAQANMSRQNTQAGLKTIELPKELITAFNNYNVMVATAT